MAKRLQDLVKDTSKEEGPESKRRRTGNLDYQELEMMESNVEKIINDQFHCHWNHKMLGSSKFFKKNNN